ncbi:MAG: N-acetylmuramoyl-L-alanine amidase [Clostridium sp.]|nr:N-acetylmuramoyl-L-alanine amidase [Clostridium sp.]MDU7084365.1 N-acetylmuramoyl-L-alanine amidase [Clostridium sp.]
MKRKSRLISCLLFIFLFLELIIPVNSGQAVYGYNGGRKIVFGDEITSKNIDVDKGEIVPEETEKDSTENKEDSLDTHSLETPSKGEKTEADEALKDSENDNQVEIPEVEPEEKTEEDFYLGEEINVLQGALLDNAVSSWAFAGIEDVNRDGIIDAKDVSAAAARYNSMKGQADYNESADVNNDGIVDVYDIARISGKSGTKGTIVVDPGHGGRDPGAIGPSGLQEKDVVLKVGLKVRDLLESYGYKVVMTRTTDVYLSLQERCDIANNSEADFFISIHNNSFEKPTVHGTETFSHNDYDLGAQMARSIQNNLVSALGRYNRGHKTSDFYVLRNTKMPAALTELAFISNPTEEALLKTDEFQTKAAKAIVQGIVGF